MECWAKLLMHMVQLIWKHFKSVKVVIGLVELYRISERRVCHCSFWDRDAKPPNERRTAVMFTNVMANSLSESTKCWIFQIVCEIFKVRSIESLKIHPESSHTGLLSVAQFQRPEMWTLNKTSCDLLFDSLSNSWAGPWPMNAAIYSRPSAVSLRVWLCETSTYVINWLTSTILCCQEKY